MMLPTYIWLVCIGAQLVDMREPPLGHVEKSGPLPGPLLLPDP